MLQDTLILPLAYYQGNGQAAFQNLANGSKDVLNLVKNLKDHKLNIFDTGWKLATTSIPLIYGPEDKKNRSLYNQAKEIRKKLAALELSSLALLIHLSDNTQRNAKSEDAPVTVQLPIKIKDCLKPYPKVKAEIINDRVTLTGFVDSEEEMTEVLEKILSISCVNVIADDLQLDLMENL